MGDALHFNGTSAYISIPSTTNLCPTNSLSVLAWIKGTAWGNGPDVNVILRKGANNPNNYQLAVPDGRLALYLDDSDSNGFRGSTTLQTGKWYHVTATWDGSYIRLYINGTLDSVTPTAKAAPIATDTLPLHIGGGSGSDLFAGMVDDVRLSGYGLGASEVENLKGVGRHRGVWILKKTELP